MTSTIANKPQARVVSVAGQRLSVNGQTKAIYSGAIHYWRLERDRWSPILDEVKKMGFTTISVYIPWEVHEVARGQFDFEGNKDIDAFLSLAEQKGFDIIARPGPQINAELTGFGYPQRILRDRELHALNSHGLPAVLTQVPRPIPALSYAAEKFFEEAGLWYDAICRILARHVNPAGKLIAAQVDNEMAYFFNVNAYAADYHPASVSRYRNFLADKYHEISTLNEIYKKEYGGFDDVEPPRLFEATTSGDVPYYLDWSEFREMYLVDAMGRLAEMLRSRGLAKIALFHNYPHPLGPGGASSGFTTPFNIPELESKLDYVGFDVYSRKELYHHVKTVLSYVVGTSRFPYIPEFIAGVWPWYLRPGDLGDEEFVTKAALMQGIKGFSRYMLVERDRWLDSPVRRDGRTRGDHVAMFSRTNGLLAESTSVDMRRQADVLLLANREYDRLEAASVLVSFPGDFLETPSGFSEYPSFMTVSEAKLGFAEAVQVSKTEWFAKSFQGLAESGYLFLLSDSALSFDRWLAFRAVVISSFEFMASALQAKLVDFATGGGTVVLGPRLPELNERMQPDRRLWDSLGPQVNEVAAGKVYRIGGGHLVLATDFSDPATVLASALAGRSLGRFVASDKRLDVTVHAPVDGGDRRLVYVANPTPEAIETEVLLEPGVAFLRELWSGRELSPARVLRATMAPYTISIYECRL